MKTNRPIEKRWTEPGPGPGLGEGGGSADRLERLARGLWGALPAPTPLTAVQVARIGRGLRERKARAQAPRWKLVMSLAAIPTAVFAALSIDHWRGPALTAEDPQEASAVAKHGHGKLRHVRHEPPPSPLVAPPPSQALPIQAPSPTESVAEPIGPPRATVATAPAARTGAASRSVEHAVASAPRPDAPAPSQPTTPPTTPPVAPPAPPDPRLAETPTPAVAAPALETALATETRLLGTALKHLRQHHDGAGALAALDEYRARFPTGALKPEAEVARLDALLLLRRRTEALTTLDQMALADQARARELHVLRGELRAEMSRYAEAIEDFDASSSSARDALAERALYGRASCRVRGGDAKAARADLELYLERFPAGQFADGARRALGP